MMNNIYANCIAGFKLKACTTKKECIWRLVHVEFDLAEELKNLPITLDDDFIKNNSTMVASMELIASLPLHYIKYLDSLKLNKRTKTTQWVDPSRQWNLCKKAVVAAARSPYIETTRIKSLV